LIAPAWGEERVRLAVGTTVLNVGYPMVTLPVTLGYWKADGYDVDVQPVGASLQAIQQMVAGNAEFAEVNASAIIQANLKNDLPVRVLLSNGIIDWSVAVDTDGPIKSIKDLKGKTIGLFSLATGGVAYLNAICVLMDSIRRKTSSSSRSASVRRRSRRCAPARCRGCCIGRPRSRRSRMPG